MLALVLALTSSAFASVAQEPFPPAAPLFPLHGLGVHEVAHARVGDLDGDGHLDVVTVGEGAYTPLRIHLGNGRGSLIRDARPPLAFPSGGFIRSAALGDLDGDGDPEPVVLADADSSAVSHIFVFDNDGTGAMSLRETLTYYSFCDELSVADQNGDGFDDLVFTRDPMARVNVVRSLGPIGFAPPLVAQSPSGFAGPTRYVLGDTNGDGMLDLISLHGTSERVVFQYLNDGAGSFHAPLEVAQLPSTTEALSLADLRGDGVLHLATSESSTPAAALLWFENDGRGRFELRQRFDDLYLALRNDWLAAVVDLDGDARQEWLAVRAGNGLERIEAQGGGVGLAEQAPRGLPGWPVQAADFDSDSAQDVLFVHAQIFSGDLALARGDGAGSLLGVVASPAQGAGEDAVLARLDGDAHLDLISFDGYPPRLFLYGGDGEGRFSWQQGLTAADHPQRVVTGDFDGNGLTDLGVVEGAFRTVELFLQGPDGTFSSAGVTPPTQVHAGGYLHAVTLDSDADGRDELALLDPFGQRLHLIGLGDAAQAAVLTALSIPGARAIHGVSETAAGAAESLELLASGSASFLSLWVLEQPLGMGTSRLTEQLALPIQDPAPAWPVYLTDGVRVEDVDGDGVRDVWAVHLDYRGGYPIQPVHSASSVWRGLSSGGFGPVDSERSPFIVAPLWTDDLDGDGALERAYLFDPEGLPHPSQLQIQRASGGAPFGDPESYMTGAAAHGDVNGDGRVDLVVAGATWTITLLNQSGR